MGKRNARRVHRFRPYERSTSIHLAQAEEMNLEDGEILEDNLEDTIKVVFDSRWTKHTGPSSSTASKPNFTTSAPKPAPCLSQPTSEVQVTAKHSGVVGASTRINKVKGSSKTSKKLAACTQTQPSVSKDHHVEPKKKIVSTPVMRMKHISVSNQAHDSVVRPGLAMQSPMGFGLCKKTPAGSGSARTANASLIASPALFALSKGGVDSFVASTPAVKRSRRDSVEMELQVVNKIPLVTLEEGELEPSVEDGEVTEEQTTVVAAGSGADSTAEVTEIRRVRMLDTFEVERRCAGLQSSCFEDVTPAVKKTAPVTAADLRADVLCLDTSGDRTLTPRQQRKARLTRAPLGSGDAAMLSKQPQRQRRKVAALQTSGAQRHRATAVRQACRTLTTPHGIRILERRHIRRPERAGHKVPHRARARKGEWWRSPQRNPPPPSDIQFGADFRQSFVSMLEQPAKRPVIIDGPNIGYAHGKNKYCSCWGIKIALDFFKSRGHRCVVFIPSSFMKPTYPAADKQLLDEMYQQGDLAFTPSRVIGGRTVTCYDDRYVVMYATRVGGVMLSRDHYRDVALEREDWRHTIENRLLIPVFVGNQLMLPPDPMGRNGPSLEEYLTFPPGEQTALLSAVPPSPVAPSGPPLPRPSEILPDPDNLPPPLVHRPAKAAEPSQKAAEPSQKPAKPSQEPAEPSQKAAKPSQKPAEPTSKPAPSLAPPGTKPALVPEHLVPSEIPMPGENAGPPECRVT